MFLKRPQNNLLPAQLASQPACYPIGPTQAPLQPPYILLYQPVYYLTLVHILQGRRNEIFYRQAHHHGFSFFDYVQQLKRQKLVNRTYLAVKLWWARGLVGLPYSGAPVLHYSIFPGPLVFSILHSNHYYYSRTIQHYKINQTHAEYISYLIYSVLFCKYYNYFITVFLGCAPHWPGSLYRLHFLFPFLFLSSCCWRTHVFWQCSSLQILAWNFLHHQEKKLLHYN